VPWQVPWCVGSSRGHAANKPGAGVGGRLGGGFGGAWWWGSCVIALEEEKSATSACIQRKQIRIEHTLMERQHSGESRKGAPRRGTAARTAGNEENYCVIALTEGRKSATSACIQSKYESNTPDGAPNRVKQEGSATTRNSTEDSRQRGKLLRYCPGRKKVSDQCVH
jgi:hypothetical protein